MQREFNSVKELGKPILEVPPGQLDQRVKTVQQAAVQAVKLANKRTAMVSNDQATNGLELVSKELQAAEVRKQGRNDEEKQSKPRKAKKQGAVKKTTPVRGLKPNPTACVPKVFLPRVCTWRFVRHGQYGAKLGAHVSES